MPKSPSTTSKKKKYNARFPPARIKKIMQTDEEVGKVAAAVPVIISRALELFIESLITETSRTTVAKNAKTLSTSHIKQTIEAHKQFDFLRDLVASVPDHQTEDNNGDTTANDGEIAVKKGRGSRPRKQKGTASRKKKGESSKASSDTSDEDEDEEGDEDTETDEEGSQDMAAASSTTLSAPFSAPGNSQAMPIPSATSTVSTAVPDMFTHNPQNMRPGASPAFTNPTLASLQNQQQQLQPYQQFYREHQHQQPFLSPAMPPYSGVPVPPAFAHNSQPQGVASYPIPPQFSNSYPSVMPSSQCQSRLHRQEGTDSAPNPQLQDLPHLQQQQQQTQPINLSFSSRAVATTVGESDDYDT